MFDPGRVESTLEWAMRYWELGWNPLAAPKGQKRPQGQWKRWQTERMTEAEVNRQFKIDGRSIWIACGRISRLLVLDCDSEDAKNEWASKIPLTTSCVKTAKGYHFYFELDEGQEAGSWSDEGFDVRAEGAGVIAPPSIHSTGFAYYWIALGQFLPAPKELLRTGKQRVPIRGRPESGGTVDALEHLLSQKPNEGERNVWLTRVCGMYALRTTDELTFNICVREAGVSVGLEAAEIAKTAKSIWEAERAKTIDGELPTRDSGYLQSGGDAGIHCLTSTKGGQSVDQWADADIRAVGVSESDGSRTFDVHVVQGGVTRETQLDSATLADGRKLLAWMAWMGIHQLNPPGAPRLGVGTMLLAYLDNQQPPEFRAVKRLGWDTDSEGYITNEGVIGWDGQREFAGVKPSLAARKATKNYKYEFGGSREAREALQEVLTFHEPDAVALIASWWASHFLKAQLMARFKLFPICEVTAASESGKTTGFIPLLTKLGGAIGAPMGEVTRAGFRDALAPHEGIVRVDDKGDLEPIKDLLRSAPMGGISTKKAGAGWEQQIEIEAHAAILITGQGLGIGKEKAIADRVVAVELGNPSRRMSRHDASKPQLVDVVAMEQRLAEGVGFGGEFVAMALDWWSAHESSYQIGTGRMANKHAIMRVGSALLDEMSGSDEWYSRVEKHLRAEADVDNNEDELTITILPYILGKIGFADGPKPGQFEHDPPTPAFWHDDQLWFCPEHVASWMSKDLRTTDPRIHSKEGIEQQARALGLGGEENKKGGRWRFKLAGTNTKRYYWSCWKYSKTIRERVEGSSGQSEIED